MSLPIDEILHAVPRTRTRMAIAHGLTLCILLAIPAIAAPQDSFWQAEEQPTWPREDRGCSDEWLVPFFDLLGRTTGDARPFLRAFPPLDDGDDPDQRPGEVDADQWAGNVELDIPEVGIRTAKAWVETKDGRIVAIKFKVRGVREEKLSTVLSYERWGMQRVVLLCGDDSYALNYWTVCGHSVELDDWDTFSIAELPRY